MSEKEQRFNPFGPEHQDDVSEHRVEVAGYTDLEQLNATFPPPPDDPEQHQSLLAQQNKGEVSLFILKNANEITGTASLLRQWQSPEYPDLKGPHVMGVQITDQHRGKHLSDKLLTACVNEAKNQGYSEIFTGVYADNKAAINAYQRNGFTEIASTRHTLPKDIDPDQVPLFYMKKSLT